LLLLLPRSRRTALRSLPATAAREWGKDATPPNNRPASQGLHAQRAQQRSSTVFSSFETFCTTGFKIELPITRADECLVTDHLIYQPARRRCSLQAELLHVILFSTIFAASPAVPSIKVQRICQFSRQYSRKEDQYKLNGRQATPTGQPINTSAVKYPYATNPLIQVACTAPVPRSCCLAAWCQILSNRASSSALCGSVRRFRPLDSARLPQLRASQFAHAAPCQTTASHRRNRIPFHSRPLDRTL
jgi:hypothetical protein